MSLFKLFALPFLVSVGACSVQAVDPNEGQPLVQYSFPIQFKIVNVDQSATQKDCGDEHTTEFVKRNLSYPQITIPANDKERLWNSLIAQKSHEGFGGYVANDCTDEDRKLEVTFASKDFISISVASATYGHGAAHGLYEERQFSWILKAGRPLDASDIFMLHKDWRDALFEKFSNAFAKVCAQYNKPCELNDAQTIEIKNIIFEPSRWKITPEFLIIPFGSYEFGSYAAGISEVKIAWAELAPYLNPYAFGKYGFLKIELPQ